MPKVVDPVVAMQRVSAVVRWGLLLEGVYIGAGYAFGPPRVSSGPALSVALAAAPVQVWGGLILVTSVMLLVPRLRWYGYASGAGVFTVFALLLLFAVPVTNGWGGPASFGFTALMHVVAAQWVKPQRLALRRVGRG